MVFDLWSEKLRRAGIIFLSVLLFSPFLLAQQPKVILAWSPNSEPELSHYHLYRDTISGTMILLDRIEKSDSMYNDLQVEVGQAYYYKLTAVDSLGNESEPSDEVMALVGLTALGDEEIEKIPIEYHLKQNYPNPFNPVTRIGYSLPHSGQVQIVIFDILGRKVRTLVDGEQPAGKHEVWWDGRDGAGRIVSTGIYYYQMTTRRYQAVKKLLYQK